MPIRKIDNLYPTPKDGVLEYGKISPYYTKDKQKNGEEFTKLGELFFQIMDVRERDIEVAKSNSQKIDLKLRTWYEPFFDRRERDTKQKIKIEDVFYHIVSLDHDKRYTYFYLQEANINVRSKL